MSFIWTGDLVAEVATHLKNGLSAAQIGAQLGISRNAVIGKVGRDESLSKIGFAWMRAKPFAGKHPERVFPQPIVETLPFHVAGKPLMALGAYECRWSMTDNEPGEQHLFCGCQTVDGKSWCEYHTQKAIDPRPLKSLAELRVD